MRRVPLLLLLLCAAAACPARAIPILIDLGPPGTTFSDIRVPFSELNGTGINGQSLTLDFTFPSDRFARLLPDATAYRVLVTLFTSSPSLVGFMHGTGFLTDEFGGALHPALEMGIASSDTGFMAMGLFPPLSALIEGHHGAHFDVMLPENPAFQVTHAEFRLLSGGRPIIIGAHIPETGGTLALLALGFVALGIGCHLPASRRA